MESSRFEIIWKWTKKLFPIVLGALGGYAYYYFIGCNRGCPITSNPWLSVLYGAFLGLILINWNMKSKLIEQKEGE